MIWYVYYKPNAFDSPATIRVNCGDMDSAFEKARQELVDSPEAKLLHALPGSAVCPNCYHAWDQHTARGCSVTGHLAIDGELYITHCPCKRRPKTVAAP